MICVAFKVISLFQKVMLSWVLLSQSYPYKNKIFQLWLMASECHGFKITCLANCKSFMNLHIHTSFVQICLTNNAYKKNLCFQRMDLFLTPCHQNLRAFLWNIFWHVLNTNCQDMHNWMPQKAFFHLILISDTNFEFCNWLTMFSHFSCF